MKTLVDHGSKRWSSLPERAALGEAYLSPTELTARTKHVTAHMVRAVGTESVSLFQVTPYHAILRLAVIDLFNEVISNCTRRFEGRLGPPDSLQWRMRPCHKYEFSWLSCANQAGSLHEDDIACKRVPCIS